MTSRFTRSAVGAVLLMATFGAMATPAGAGPIDDKRAQAASIADQVEMTGHRIAALGEQYNGAQYALDQANAQIAEAEQRLAAAKAQEESVRQRLRDRAARLYRGAGRTTPLAAFDSKSVREFGTRSKYADLAASKDRATAADLADLQDAVAVQRKSLEGVKARAEAQRSAAAAAKQQLETLNARQRAVLASVQGQLAVLVQQEQARREAAQRAAAQAKLQAARAAAPRPTARPTTGPGTRAPAPLPTLPNVPVSGRVAAVIEYARQQIGKPYVFATAGPNTFDCSGLTMMAWRQAGVAMAHFSGAQFNAFPHVPLSDLQPGDLVFKGPGGRDHVALYIGGGMQIAATHTGSFVKLQPISTNLSGAVRPG